MSPNETQGSPAAGQAVLLGIGGGGGTIVARAAALNERPPVLIAAADTDVEALATCEGVAKVELRSEWLPEGKTGGDALLGERAASDSAGELETLLNSARLLVMVAAFGGGTGTGATRVIAGLAKERGIVSILIAAEPFSFEGSGRLREARASLEPLRRVVDVVIPVPNDMLFNTVSADTPAPEAFAIIDGLLARVALGLARLAVSTGVWSVDFARLKKLLRQRATGCSLAVGGGHGENRWRDAVDEFLSCPLLNREALRESADFALLTVIGDDSLAIGEVRTCLDALQGQLPDDIDLITGAYVEPGSEGLHLTGILGHRPDTPAPTPDAVDAPNAVPSAPPASQRAETPPPSRNKQGKQRPVQAELPLQEQSLGAFAHCSPTTHRGENLDIPTFQRRDLRLDLESGMPAGSPLVSDDDEGEQA